MERNVSIFIKADYKGEFNLRSAEKELMIKVIKKYAGNSNFIRKALQVNKRAYSDKIIQHGLNPKEIAKKELLRMNGKEYNW